MGGNALEVLLHYKEKINRNSQNQAVLLHCLGKLDLVKVDIQLLQHTMIGKTVGMIKKSCSDSEVGARARELVAKWKEVVRLEEIAAQEADEARSDDGESLSSEDQNGADEEEHAEPATYVPTPIPSEYIPTPIVKLEKESRSEEQDVSRSHKSTSRQDSVRIKSEPSENHSDTASQSAIISNSDLEEKEKNYKKHKSSKSHKDKDIKREREDSREREARKQEERSKRKEEERERRKAKEREERKQAQEQERREEKEKRKEDEKMKRKEEDKLREEKKKKRGKKMKEE